MNNGTPQHDLSYNNVSCAIGLWPYIGAGDNGTVTDTTAPATTISLH